MKHGAELPIPPAAQRDPNAVEAGRIWIVEEGQHVSLRPDPWEDPGNWGIMLVDLARHVADARAQVGADPDQVMGRIKELFDAEWEAPTDDPEGEWMHEDEK